MHGTYHSVMHGAAHAACLGADVSLMGRLGLINGCICCLVSLTVWVRLLKA